MVYDYVITLKKPDYRFIDQITLIMLLFAILLFGYFYYIHPRTGFSYIAFAAGVLITTLFILSRKKRTGVVYFRLPLLIAAAGWIVGTERNILMGVLYALAGLFERQVKFSQEVGFSEEEIAFNTFPKKRLAWNEVNNALIKDGLITIDQKTNKLFQKEIESGVSQQVEKEFNEFCRQQIEKAVVVDSGRIG